MVDFGIAGLCHVNESDKNEAATLKYMTPEMIINKGSVASPPMDVWAIGIMMFCMIFNKFPFSGTTRDEIKAKITGATHVLPKTKLITKECQDFIAQCLIKNPDERIKIEKMLSHPWL